MKNNKGFYIYEIQETPKNQKEKDSHPNIKIWKGSKRRFILFPRK